MTINNSDITVYENFNNMELPANILRGIYEHGFEVPSPIQQKAVVPIKNGKNVIAQAQSGMGKTAAFSLGLLSRLDEDQIKIQAIVLAPTRELARQIKDVITSLSRYTKITSHVCIGGTRVSEDREAIRKGVNIMIGTPGRLNQLLCPEKFAQSSFQSKPDLSELKTLIIDEADEMLDKGFRPAVAEIYNICPENAQVVLVSATFTDEVAALAETIAAGAQKILVKNENLTLEGIQQARFVIDTELKREALLQLVESVQTQVGIIYVQSIEDCKSIHKYLSDKGLPIAEMNSQLLQSERDATMKEFKAGNIRYLVATDLMARGIDVQNLGIVINYDLPSDNASYLHRVGRAGRFGKKGIAVNFVTSEDEERRLAEIENFYSTKIKDLDEETLNAWGAEE